MTDHNHTILLTGVPGVGKTTIANKIVDKYDIKLLNFGDVLFELIKEKGIEGIEHIDEIRVKLEPEVYHDLQIETASKIKYESQGNTLISSHLTIDTPFGFIPGFPSTVIKILKPCLTVLVEAPLIVQDILSVQLRKDQYLLTMISQPLIAGLVILTSLECLRG